VAVGGSEMAFNDVISLSDKLYRPLAPATSCPINGIIETAEWA
jgi:hypothetical protein